MPRPPAPPDPAPDASCDPTPDRQSPDRQSPDRPDQERPQVCREASPPMHPLPSQPNRADKPIPLFEHSVVPMLLVDPANGVIVDANPAACRFYGYPRERMAGMPVSAINTLTGRELAERMDEAFRCDRSAFRFRHRTASGLERDVEVHSGPVWLHGRALLHSVVHDVSALRDSTRRVDRVQRLNDLRAALIRGGSPEEKLRLLAREVLSIFGAGTCRIWLAQIGRAHV